LDDVREDVERVRREFDSALSAANDGPGIESVRVEFLSRKGRIAQPFKVLGGLAPDDRGEAGRLLNELKDRAEGDVGKRIAASAAATRNARLEQERLDVTMPGPARPLGHLHPLTVVQREIEAIFLRMGFDVATGPEIETEYYNFEALNIPADHPARADWDTFYVSDTTLLRPHTSPVQIRVMESTPPPIRIICPGRCYRRDAQDATHSPVFHQIELLWVEEGLSLAHLKYVLELFTREFFGPGYEMRFSGDFFPFTEPSVQVHIKAPGAERWLEIMGAGMVDPAVLEGVGYDPERLSGFAFGLGLERMAMLKYGIDDIRAFLSNDLRFLRQF